MSSSPPQFLTSRARNSSGEGLNNDEYSRSHSPLLAPQTHTLSTRTELSSLSPAKYPISKRSSPINSPPSATSRTPRTVGNQLGFTPTQLSIQPSHQTTSTSFLLPPPVTSYAFAQTKSLYDIQRSPIYNLQQQVKALTAELQELLDAQSTGLLMNSAAIVETDNAEKKGQETPRSGRGGWDGGVTFSINTQEVRGPKISLKAARQGIIRAMHALSEVKSTEEGWYAMEEAERLKNISQVIEWENKKRELEEGLKEVEEGEEVRRVVELRKEKEDVELEIRKVEKRLAALKIHHSNLLSRISSLESTLSSRSSAYRQSLSVIASSESRFFSSLSAKFRSHEVALEHWKAEADAMRVKKEHARLERDALREGVIEWETALAIVRGFEADLTRQMGFASAGIEKPHVMSEQEGNTRRSRTRILDTTSALTSPDRRGYSSPSISLGNKSKPIPATSESFTGSSDRRTPLLHHFDTLLSDPGDDGRFPEDFYPLTSSKSKSTVQGPTERKLNYQILKAIEEVLLKLDEKVELAKSKNWKLLVCCLAAEAQAFREAREIMVQRLQNDKEAKSKSAVTEEPNVGKHKLFGDSGGEGVGLKSKFGRMEIESKLSSVVSRHGERAGILGSNHEASIYDNDDALVKLGGVQDFDGVGLIRVENEETRPFNMEMELASIQPSHHTYGHKTFDTNSQSHSSIQDSSSLSVSPKTLSRKTTRAPKRRMTINQENVGGMDGSGWDREHQHHYHQHNSYLLHSGDEEEDDVTLKGSIHDRELQLLKGPTVGQVMRRQESSGGGVGMPGSSTCSSNGPSGIALSLGAVAALAVAPWGSIRSPAGGYGEVEDLSHSRGGDGSGSSSGGINSIETAAEETHAGLIYWP